MCDRGFTDLWAMVMSRSRVFLSLGAQLMLPWISSPLCTGGGGGGGEREGGVRRG